MSTISCRNNPAGISALLRSAILRFAGTGIVTLVFATAALAQPPASQAPAAVDTPAVPQDATHQHAALATHAAPMHLGPATCASSVCHGRANASDSTTVMQNEFRVWSREDPHSRAYNTLLSEKSRAIARRLGLPDAHTAKVCLDCHADNVPEAQRGPQFQLTDGVGCESCHGAAGEWIRSHAESGVTHADNLAKGLYATDDAGARAKLCLTCHLGTPEKFAGHDMMAAGHPRLSFELVAFTANQPAHYVVDADYIERKGDISTASMWATGLISAERSRLELLRSPRFVGHGLFPEPALFDCHACHHPMDDVRWSPLALHKGLPAGAIRLNDGNLVMLVSLGQALSPARGAALESAGNALHRASLRDAAALREQAAALIVQLDALQADVAARSFTPVELGQLRRLLLTRASNGTFRDFAAAEQAFLAVETLTLELGDDAALRPALDRWFASVRDEHRFDHRRFATQAGQINNSLK